jgi:hypothetical protein
VIDIVELVTLLLGTCPPDPPIEPLELGFFDRFEITAVPLPVISSAPSGIPPRGGTFSLFLLNATFTSQISDQTDLY